MTFSTGLLYYYFLHCVLWISVVQQVRHEWIFVFGFDSQLKDLCFFSKLLYKIHADFVNKGNI